MTLPQNLFSFQKMELSSCRRLLSIHIFQHCEVKTRSDEEDLSVHPAEKIQLN